MVIRRRNEAKYLEKVKTSKMFCPSVKFLSRPHSLHGHVRRRRADREGLAEFVYSNCPPPPPTYNFSELSIELTQGHARKVVTLLVAKNRRKRKFGGASDSVVGRWEGVDILREGLGDMQVSLADQKPVHAVAKPFQQGPCQFNSYPHVDLIL